ncbi:MAG: SIMPL domain-containing protein [Chloroflexota bacterium]|nr:SIMPL domain-containing protein [Chloroflexota bacterium]
MRNLTLLISTLLFVPLLVACGQESPVVEPTQVGPAPAPAPSADPTIVPTTEPTHPPATRAGETSQGMDLPTETPASADSAGPAHIVPVATHLDSAPRLLAGTGFRATPIDLLVESRGVHRQIQMPQARSTDDSITVSAIGKVTVTPDQARIIVLPEEDYGPFGPQRFSQKQEQDITQALSQVGIDAELIDFQSHGRYEPSAVSVPVDVGDIEAQGETVVEAVEDVIGRAGHYGVSFGLSEESCVEATALARREAIPVAEAAADDLSQALDLQRGEAVAVLEYASQNPFFSDPFSTSDPCTGGNRYGVGPLLAFHVEPEVEVLVGLQISYRLR